MRIRNLALAVALIAALAGATVARAGDIVTVPTANQLRQGEVDIAYYYLGLDFPKQMPQHVNAETIYVGLTNEIELDAHRYDIDKGPDETIWIINYKLLNETLVTPDIVIGARDLTEKLSKTSYYLCAAKTLNPPKVGPPILPIVRLHLSVGTQDDSLLGEGRHEGLFGGVQVLFRMKPQIGLVALHDGTDLITGLTYKPGPAMPTIKGGTYGKHWWVGVSYTIEPLIK